LRIVIRRAADNRVVAVVAVEGAVGGINVEVKRIIFKCAAVTIGKGNGRNFFMRTTPKGESRTRPSTVGYSLILRGDG